MFGNLVSERKSFKFDDEEFIHAKVSNQCNFISDLINIIGISESINAANEARRLAEEGGRLSQAASYANAAERINIGNLNAGAVVKAASNTASGLCDVGYSNADAQIKAALHNLRMYEMQSQEELRIHRMDEKWHAGEIRARISGTGVMVGSGSPMAYLRSEIEKGLDERRFIQTRDAYTLMGIGEDGLRTSLLTIKTANWNAKVTQENASLQAGVMMAEAMADAAAMQRQGDIAAAVGVANGQAARSSGYASAIGQLGNAIGGFQNTYQNMQQRQYSNPYRNMASSAAGGRNTVGYGSYNAVTGSGGF